MIFLVHFKFNITEIMVVDHNGQILIRAAHVRIEANAHMFCDFPEENE